MIFFEAGTPTCHDRPAPRCRQADYGTMAKPQGAGPLQDIRRGARRTPQHARYSKSGKQLRSGAGYHTAALWAGRSPSGKPLCTVLPDSP